MEKKRYTVEITEKGAMKAKPAIWYCAYPLKRFIVKKPTQWKGVYQVVEGEHKGMIIDSLDCMVVVD